MEPSEPRRVTLRGRALLHHPYYNKGTAFSREEREACGLEGLLPHHVSTIDEQCRRMYKNIVRPSDPLERYIALLSLQTRNVHLYYELLSRHTEEFMPIVYTPTVGRACQEFSHIFRGAHGVWITPDNIDRIGQIFDNTHQRDVRLIVATDNERILGLGDQGAGGMGIPIGKLALYTMAAGIHPSKTLPVSLDVGTDNRALLDDPFYLGWPHPRLRGPAYDALIERFVVAVKHRFPQALLQWEDFKKNTAFDLLERYAGRILSFNDDIQGTAGVTLAALLNVARMTGVALERQRILIVGGGAAGIGIARLLRTALARRGLRGDGLRRAIAIVDSQGLLTEARAPVDRHKVDFAWTQDLVRTLPVESGGLSDLASVVRAFRPTILLGTSGMPGVFTEAMVRDMAAFNERPAIFPLSNPNSKSEANPADLVAWSSGRAIIGTGSPFPAHTHNGRTHRFAQTNNVYIFPGVGLGVLVAEASKVTDEMFYVAAEALAGLVSAAELQQGQLYPHLTILRHASAVIAAAVVREARDQHLGRPIEDEKIEAEVAAFMWAPRYPDMVPA